ncbi:MAG: LPS export ABC transporter periplasmic protein LptC [Acidobacteriota bacterium]
MTTDSPNAPPDSASPGEPTDRTDDDGAGSASTNDAGIRNTEQRRRDLSAALGSRRRNFEPPAADAPDPTETQVVSRARSPYRWFRRLLLALGVVAIAALGVLLAAYRFGTEGERPEDQATIGDDDAVTSGQNIDYTQTSGNVPIFRVRAERSVQTRDDISNLEGVILDLFGEGGRQYTIESQRAEIDRQRSQAKLRGDVRVHGWRELELSSRELELQDGGRLLRSSGTVEMRWKANDVPLIGRASQLRFDRQEDIVQLLGGVHIKSADGSTTPVRLDADRVVYHRAQNSLEAAEDVYLRWGSQELRTHHLAIHMWPDGESLRFLKAHFDVSGSLLAPVEGSELGGTRIEFSGQMLEVRPNPEEPDYRRVLLDGSATPTPARRNPRTVVARLESIAADGTARRLTGRKIDAGLRGGDLVQAVSWGDPFEVVEYLDLDEPYYLRRACADRATAKFLDDGGLQSIFLEGQVELRDFDLFVAGGDTATLDVADGRLAVRGESVDLYTEQAQLTAPQVDYNRDGGVLRATRGVEAQFASSSTLDAGPFAGSQGPIRIASKEAMWTESPETFVFEGGVRAWRGSELLLAEELRGRRGNGEIAASGGVKTVWQPAPRPGASELEPIEVTAALLSYGADRSELVYRDEVEVMQDGRKIACNELVVELEPGSGRARRMTCVDQVELVDPIKGQRVTGNRAVYSVADRRVEIFGDEVELIDGSDNRLVGRYLVYDTVSGRSRLRGRPPAPGETPEAFGSR